MSKTKDENPMIKARMKVAKKALQSGIKKRDEGNKEILEAEKLIIDIQAECQHPPHELITLRSHDAKKCGICGKNMSDG